MAQRRPVAGAADLARWRDAALSIAEDADELALRGFRRELTVDRKADRTLVTDVDRSIEQMMRDRLGTAFPGCGFVGEEYGTTDSGASLTWYVDPIDGTANFVRGVPVFATLLAAALDGELQVGVVSAPAMRERWLAWRGGGAWRDLERIQVSRIAAIEDAQLVYGSRSEDLRSGLVPGLDRTLAEAWRERGFGDFWGHMLVAEGAAEAMIETGAHPWDWAAPLVIVEEAGGMFTTASGERRIDGDSAIATNGLVHDELLARLGREDECTSS